ncbi:hypothetical protein BY458DRAFT_545806, partial [Sporodiniella umbellata]
MTSRKKIDGVAFLKLTVLHVFRKQCRAMQERVLCFLENSVTPFSAHALDMFSMSGKITYKNGQENFYTKDGKKAINWNFYALSLVLIIPRLMTTKEKKIRLSASLAKTQLEFSRSSLRLVLHITACFYFEARNLNLVLLCWI